MKRSIFAFLSQNQIVTALLIVGIGWLIVEIRGILIALFVSYILMASIEPYAQALKRARVPSALAVIIPYLFAVIILALILLSLVPFLVSQIQILLSRFPSYLSSDVRFLGIPIGAVNLDEIAAKELGNIGENVIAFTSRIFGGLVSVISIFAVSFYLLLYRETVRENFVSLFSKPTQAKVRKITLLAEEKLGGWLRGQLVLSGFIGVVTWVALTILGLEFALPLAVIAGLLEIVPTIGPIIAAIPAIIVALNISFPMALIVGVAYFLIQLLENNILVPRIMQRAVGLNPIVIIIGIIIGGKLLGVPGALLAIPFISLLVVIYRNI